MRASKAVFFMHKDRPVAQLPICAAPGMRPGLRAFLMLMLGVVVLTLPSMGASDRPPKRQAPIQRLPQPFQAILWARTHA